MRIIAGLAGGIRLKNRKNSRVRPTQDRVRESVFNMLAPYLPETRILDLFAGFGSIGLEALSRGAVAAVFVEKARRNARLIEENIARCGFQDKTEVVIEDVFRYLQGLAKEGSRAKFDFIFMDPPYSQGLVPRTVEYIITAGILAADGLIVCEQYTDDPPPTAEGVIQARVKEYGDTTVRILQLEGD